MLSHEAREITSQRPAPSTATRNRFFHVLEFGLHSKGLRLQQLRETAYASRNQISPGSEVSWEVKQLCSTDGRQVIANYEEM